MEYNETLSIENICGGAVPERFERELVELLKNISDPNTRADQKRTITLEFQFEPFPFLFRLRNQDGAPPNCALFEADGGAWKLEAVKNIAEFLEKSLAKGVSVVF